MDRRSKVSINVDMTTRVRSSRLRALKMPKGSRKRLLLLPPTACVREPLSQ